MIALGCCAEVYLAAEMSASIKAADLESRAYSRKSGRSMGRLIVRWFPAVWVWWGDSTHRVVANEICRISHRISAIAKDSRLKCGPLIPDEPRNHGQMGFRNASIFGSSCSDDVVLLSREHPWMGFLDQQLAAEAYQRGAAWAFRTADSHKKADGTEQDHPCKVFSEFQDTAASDVCKP